MKMTMRSITRSKLPWHVLPIAVIIIAAFAMRLRGLNFGLPALLDPDESIFVLIALKLLKEHTLNPGWFGHPGTTTIYSLALVEAGIVVVGTLTGGFADTTAFSKALFHDPAVAFLPGRVVMLISGLIVILLAYRLARRVFDPRVALVTAALLAIDPIHIRYSQIIRTDMQSTIFMLLTLLAAMRIVERGSLRTYLVAGMWVGIACATKWPAGTVAAGVAGAAVLRIRLEPSEYRTVLRRLGGFALMAVASCVIVSPYLILDFGTVVSNLHGEGRAVHVGATGNGFLANIGWYLGNPLCDALGICGLALAAAGLVAGARRQPIFGYVVGSAIGAFFVSITIQNLIWERWVVPLLPLLTIGLAYATVALVDKVRTQAPRFKLPVAIALTLLVAVPPLRVANAQAAERAVDTRRLATAWAMQHIPAGNTVAIEYLAFDALSAPWHFLYPGGNRGCFDPRTFVTRQITVSTVGSWHSSRPVVDFADIEPNRTASCRADYLIFANYDRYVAESGRFPTEIANYRRIAAGGHEVAVFTPRWGSVGGPIVRIIRLPACHAQAISAREPRCHS